MRLRDEDLPAFWAGLGLPGVVDAHVHFMPPRLQAKVWAYFDEGGPLLGRDWPIRYRLDEQQRVDRLRAMGVLGFPALLYPHRPGMAAALNAWAADFAARVPECLHTATLFAEPQAADYVAAAIAAGARIFKAHIQVGGYDPRDPVLDPVWGLLSDAGVPVVVHCGSGPVPVRFTGPEVFGQVLAAHPRLVAVIAHLGAPEHAEFLDLAARHPRVHLDTTGVFTDFFERMSTFPRELLPLLSDLGDRILFGTDFPTIPYRYADQVRALAELELGEDWLRAVLLRNAQRLWPELAGR